MDTIPYFFERNIRNFKVFDPKNGVVDSELIQHISRKDWYGGICIYF